MNLPGKLCKNCFSYVGNTKGSCPVCGYVRGGAPERDVLPRGTRLAGRYVLGGKIGRGGFGVTYLAYDTVGKKTVAVKEYFPSMLARRGRGLHVIPTGEKSAEQFNIGAEKFFDEADLVRRFNGNPNIVSIFDCFYENNTAYSVMEYLDGITLENYVEAYGALSSGQTLYIADKLTMALLVLHSGGVLHRDISPDNVMLCRDGSVKLIDFGAARQFLSEGTAGYTVIMKTGFSPAEQYSQGSDVDQRADIYSAGMVLYYALSGNVPESPYRRMENDAMFAENVSGAESGLWAVVVRAAALKPSERFKTAEEFRSALAGLRFNPAAVAVPEDYNSLRTEGAQERGPGGKRAARIALAAAAGVICIAAVTAGVLAARTSSPPLTTELTLDSEYRGDFQVGGLIPSAELLKFGGDVEVTIRIEPWEDMPNGDLHGVIPVNSGDHSVLKYLTAPGELWADENGWFNIEKGKRELTVVISREGIESLGDGGLSFESYNCYIAAATLRPSKEQNTILLMDYHKAANAPYTVTDNESGKIVTAELGVDRVMDWGAHRSQNIPKSAFYAFGGDVMVTVAIQDVPGETELMPDWRVIYVTNGGFCFDVFEDDVYVAAIPVSDGKVHIERIQDYGIRLEPGYNECVLIVPERVKEKMSAGMAFNAKNIRVTSVTLSSYNGEFTDLI